MQVRYIVLLYHLLYLLLAVATINILAGGATDNCLYVLLITALTMM